VQQIFFRLVGILARTSPAGNAYAPLFFAAWIFFKNSRADFCRLTSMNCRNCGATSFFSLRLLLDSGISIVCSLKDCLPRIVTQAVSRLCGVVQESLDFFSVAARIRTGRLHSLDSHLPDATKWHEMLVFLYTYRLPSANNPE
jgi:hypothetical protein